MPSGVRAKAVVRVREASLLWSWLRAWQMPPASARIVEMRRCAEARQQRAAGLLQDQRGFGQGIGDQATLGHNASEAIRRNGLAVSAVHMGTDNIAVMATPFDIAATARYGSDFDFEYGGCLSRPLKL